MKKKLKIQESITDAGAKRISKFYSVPFEQVQKAFNVFDNCVLSGEAEDMTISDMGIRIRQCVTGALEAKDPLVWNKIAREFREDYNDLRRKVWK